MNDGYKEVRVGPKKVKIPKEWQRVSLEYVSKNSGQYGANQSAMPFDENEYRYIRVTDLTDNGHLSNEEKKSIPKKDNEKYELKKGDIVFARTGTPGLTYVFNENDSNMDYAFAGYLIRFELKDNIASNYLSYYTQSYHYWSWIRSTQRSTTLSNINASEFRTLPIIKPPLPEQRRIAEILSTVDEAIQKTDEVIEKAERLKKGLMQDLLTKGIGHDEFKEVQIGPKTVEIPVEWDIKTLGNEEGLCKVETGGTPKTSTDEYWNGDIPWVTPTDITNNDQIYISDSERKITKEGLRNSSAKLLPVGSILLTTRATIGEASINTVPMATNQGFKSLICKEETNNEFLYYLIHQEKERLASLGGGSTFDEVSKKDVVGFEVVSPPVKEQKKIAKILTTIDSKIKKEDKYKERLKNLKKGMMQDLLTGKIRVNI